MYIAVEVLFFIFRMLKDEKRGFSQSLELFTIDICDKYFFLYIIIRKKEDKNFSVFLKRKKKRH